MVVGHPRFEFHALIAGESAEFASAGEKFAALREAWEEHNAHRSVIDFDHPAYHQIMAMGAEAVPFLIELLSQGDTDWFYALKCITGVNPETPGKRQTARELIDAWIAWGESHGVPVASSCAVG